VTQPPANAGPRPLRVLVVDDEPNIRDTLALCLEGAGGRVEKAATGAAARLGDLESRLSEAGPEARLDSASPRMRAVLEAIEKAAPHDVA
jgi:NtrC-family two-component system response regulator AlgB